MVCFPHEVLDIQGNEWGEILPKWSPAGSFENCRDLKHSTADFLRLYTKYSETYIIEVRDQSTIDVKFIDDSFILNQETQKKKYLIIPSYRPVQWIHFTQAPVRVCAYSDIETIESSSSMTCESSCKFTDLTAENSVIAKFPRQLDKPTNEFFLTAEEIPDKEDVTLCTILTYDRLLRIRQMAEMYQGPISAAVYLVDVNKEMPILLKEWLSSPAMRKHVDVHLVVDDKINSIDWPDRPFPVNILRNVGLKYARTEYVSFIEADFIPNRSFKEDVKLIKSHMRDHPKSVYVIPSFYTWNMDIAKPDFDLNNFPKSKEEINKNNKYELKPMNEVFSSHRQIPYSKWFTAKSNEVIHIGTLSSQEPYYIAHRSMPKFEPIFIGCGQDKVQHTSELVSRGWDFYMIPQGFIVHLDSTGMGSAWCTKFGSRWSDMKWKVMNERVSHSRIDSQQLTEWWDLVPTVQNDNCDLPPMVDDNTQPNESQIELDRVKRALNSEKKKQDELLFELDRSRSSMLSLQNLLTEKEAQLSKLNSTNELMSQAIFMIMSVLLIFGIYSCFTNRKRSHMNRVLP